MIAESFMLGLKGFTLMLFRGLFTRDRPQWRYLCVAMVWDKLATP